MRVIFFSFFPLQLFNDCVEEKLQRYENFMLLSSNIQPHFVTFILVACSRVRKEDIQEHAYI